MVTAALAAGCTLLALAPPRRPFALGVLSFLLGFALNELPFVAARRFVGQLRATSANPVVYAELPGAQHRFDRFHSLRFDTVVDAIEAFAA